MYIPKTLHEENVHNSYLVGLIFSTSWRVAPKQNQNLYGDMDLNKKVSKVSVSGSSLEPKFEIFILFIYLDF